MWSLSKNKLLGTKVSRQVPITTTNTSSMRLCFTRSIMTTPKSSNLSCQKHGVQYFLIVELARLFMVMNGLASMWTTSVKKTSNKYSTLKAITCTSLTVTNTKSEKHFALKLHRQFVHPNEEKLLQLITNAGSLWCNNKELIKEVKDISRSCPTCKIHRKPPQHQ